MAKKTPLYDEHVSLNGKIVDFGGFLLPVQYKTGIIAEHKAVRSAAGLFDVSHMGEFILKGEDALQNIQKIITNNCNNMVPGQIHYSPMCYEDGGVVDDLLVYKENDEQYLIVVNASNIEKDFKWMSNLIEGKAELENISDNVGQVALQGPLSEQILEKLVSNDSIPKKYYTFVENIDILGFKALISRTGYTGEDGFEIYTDKKDIVTLWNKLLEVGNEFGLIPCGLGARDTLRLEATFPLYGHEITKDITPYEARLGIFVKLDKDNFIGKDALIKNKENLSRRRVCLKMVDRGIAREGAKVIYNDKEVGYVLSGTHSPTLGMAIATAMVPIDLNDVGTKLQIDVRGKLLTAEVIKGPFYKRA